MSRSQSVVLAQTQLPPSVIRICVVAEFREIGSPTRHVVHLNAAAIFLPLPYNARGLPRHDSARWQTGQCLQTALCRGCGGTLCCCAHRAVVLTVWLLLLKAARGAHGCPNSSCCCHKQALRIAAACRARAARAVPGGSMPAGLSEVPCSRISKGPSWGFRLRAKCASRA